MTSHTFYKHLIIPLFTLLLIGWSQSTYAQTTTDSIAVARAEVYPNPFNASLTIKPNKVIEDIEEITIYDALGNTIYQFSPDDWDQIEIDWNGSHLQRGTYVVFIRTRDEDPESIIIQKVQ